VVVNDLLSETIIIINLHLEKYESPHPHPHPYPCLQPGLQRSSIAIAKNIKQGVISIKESGIQNQNVKV
jgi:hypothetical protein